MKKNRYILLSVMVLFSILFAALPLTSHAAVPVFPAAPSISVQPVNATTLRISWGLVSGANAYLIQRSNTISGPWTQVATAITTNFFNNTGLTPGHTYFYRVAAYQLVNNVPNYGSWSVVRYGVPLAAPNLAIAVKSATSSRLSWGLVTGAIGYDISRATAATGPWTVIATGATANYYDDLGLTSGSTYYYKIIPYKLVGSSKFYGPWSPIRYGIPLGIPNLSVTSVNSSAVRLTWNAITGASGYAVSRALAASGPWTLLSSSVTTNSYASAGLSTGTIYYYKVMPYKLVGSSKFFGLWSSIKAGVALSAPNLMVSQGGATSLKLSWGTIAGVSGYRVERSSTSAGPWLTVANVITNYYVNSGLASGATYFYRITAYKTYSTSSKAYGPPSAVKYGAPLAVPILTISSVNSSTVKAVWNTITGASGYMLVRSTTASGPWTVISSSLTANSYTNSGLTTGTRYYYKVLPYKIIGSYKYLGLWASVKSGVPLATSSLTVAPNNATSLKLTWTAVSGVSGYIIKRSTTVSGPWTFVATTTGTSLINTGTSGTTYFYTVAPYKMFGTDRLYGPVSAVKYGVPLAKPIISILNVSGTELHVSWDAVPGASAYIVARALSASGPWTIITSTVTFTGYPSSGLTPGTIYYYKVLPYKNVGSSRYYGMWSDVQSKLAIDTPKNLRATVVTSNSIHILWDPVLTASGYEIASAHPGTSYSYLFTTQTSYAFINRASNTTYYFAVRAYKLFGTTKVYGRWSGTITVKTDP